MTYTIDQADVLAWAQRRHEFADGRLIAVTAAPQAQGGQRSLFDDVEET